jgi:Rhodopirellula transposase DDE domain
MRIPMEVRGQLATRLAVLLPHLNERQQRLALAVEARLLGHGGVRAVAQVAGVSETTVRKGVVEPEAGQTPLPPGRVRRPGGGRKPAARRDPDLLPALLALVEPDERGDPESPLRWTTKSLRHLAEALTRQGHPVSAPTVGRLLQREGVQPAGQRQDAGRRPAPRPRCPVPLPQPTGQGPPGRRRAGHQRRHQQARTAGAAAHGRAGVAPQGPAGQGGRPPPASSPAQTSSRRSRRGSTT